MFLLSKVHKRNLFSIIWCFNCWHRRNELKTKNNELLQHATSLNDQVVQLKQQIMDHMKTGCQILMPNAQSLAQAWTNCYTDIWYGSNYSIFSWYLVQSCKDRLWFSACPAAVRDNEFIITEHISVLRPILSYFTEIKFAENCIRKSNVPLLIDRSISRQQWVPMQYVIHLLNISH